MRAVTIICLLLVLAFVSQAQFTTPGRRTAFTPPAVVTAAHWVPVDLKYYWDRTNSDFCKRSDQCLVKVSYNESLDDQPSLYWTGRSADEKPKCIADTQFIADDYCDNGEWSSRTKQIGEHLLAIALDESPNSFSLFCDDYESVLNRYEYSTQYGLTTEFLGRFCHPNDGALLENCANNFCVIDYGGNIAFALSINTNISGDNSPLQALNKSQSFCDTAKTPDGNFHECGENVWYNERLQSILYKPTSGTPSSPSQATNDLFLDSFNILNDYIFSTVHSPSWQQYNYDEFFNHTPSFKSTFIAKDGNQLAYGFKETNMTDSRISYAGFYLSNIELPDNACAQYIKPIDDLANCELPTQSEFFVVAHSSAGTPSLVDHWADMTGKLRVS